MLRLIVSLSWTLPCLAYTILGSCPANVSVCYGVPDFQVGCESIKGSYFENKAVGEVGKCIVPGPAVQLIPCQGRSCTLTPLANYTAGCKAVGGFISGSLTSGGMYVCSIRGHITQFMACPADATNCQIMPGFTEWCNRGGFVDAFFNSLPECVVPGDISYFRPCNGSTSGCTFDGAEFNRACTGLGGMITAQVNGLPFCQVMGKVGIMEPCPGRVTGCSFSQNDFGASCNMLSGFVMTNGGSNLPQCIFKDFA